MVVGSVLAIAQTDVKRMLAYSSIAHAGFILTGLTAAGPAGIRAAMFYLVGIRRDDARGVRRRDARVGRGEERTRIADLHGAGAANARAGRG